MKGVSISRSITARVTGFSFILVDLNLAEMVTQTLGLLKSSCITLLSIYRFSSISLLL